MDSFIIDIWLSSVFRNFLNKARAQKFILSWSRWNVFARKFIRYLNSLAHILHINEKHRNGILKVWSIYNFHKFPGYHEDGKLNRELSEELYYSDSELVILEEDFDDTVTEQVTPLWNWNIEFYSLSEYFDTFPQVGERIVAKRLGMMEIQYDFKKGCFRRI